ncbi:type VI secretion system baseplate subunit TssF [Thalassotalea euphylliae]|uniref:Type VI secretion system baseplate subunit TssF n=1 Tax=Thalassotalea euphylliae TaxID=1655234 RepID=A0A3E0TUT8_9GAMM|nr:type VI secretion system baseplate subunit TssF [Thalassotalea euphylliae]REL27685.1 type VI secretion system baseplate subunit TssF [Thalassotalea euphylliae]
MDPRLLELYNQELKFIREMGAEFAQEYPKVASRLGIEGFDCADPYVERLLEGFAFLTSRIQLQLNQQFPRFTENLIQHLFPTYLMPTPSVLVAQLTPDMDDASLLDGVEIKRDTALRSLLSKGVQTSCEYRTVQPTQLFPLQLESAEYINTQAIAAYTAQSNTKHRIKAGISITLSTSENFALHEIALNELSLYLRGSEAFPMYLFELLLSGFGELWFRDNTTSAWKKGNEHTQMTSDCTAYDNALLPYTPRYFDGFRLIKEYFYFPKRLLFLSLTAMKAVFKRCKTNKVELLLLLSKHDPRLENLVNADNFGLFCVPAVNLFERNADRIAINQYQSEYHVVADRLRPTDYEICMIDEVTGYGTGLDVKTHFTPIFANQGESQASRSNAYFNVHRQPRKLTAKQTRNGPRSSYVGTESFISLVDQKHQPFELDLKQLAVKTKCSNRDLPILMPLGKGKTDFTLDISLPTTSIRCLEGPTKPKPPQAIGEANWQLISHLTFNYIGFTGESEQTLTKQLKALMQLFVERHDAFGQKQIDGIQSITLSSCTRRIDIPGPICFARGVAIELTVDEESYEGTGVFLLGVVLEQFFAQLVHVNSFTQLTLNSSHKGEIYTWPIRMGMKTHL